MTDPKGAADDQPGLIMEFRKLGRQMGRTLEATWRSEERKQAERELRAGAKAFAEELEGAWERARGTDPADLGAKARRTAADGLRWMSAELAELAERFTPVREDADPGGDDEPRDRA